MKIARSPIKIGFLCLILCVIGAWVAYQYIYLPVVTQASTVSAAEAGNLPQLKMLHARGMSLDYHDPRKFMWTPLMAAAYAGHSNIVAYLLKQGVDVEARDAHDKTALMWAVDGTSTDFSIVEMLLDNGAKTNALDDNGSTVFDYASASPESKRLLQILSRNKPLK